MAIEIDEDYSLPTETNRSDGYDGFFSRRGGSLFRSVASSQVAAAIKPKASKVQPSLIDLTRIRASRPKKVVGTFLDKDTNKKYEIVPPPPAQGKRVYVPGKVWDMYHFLKDFPFVKTALLVVILDKLGAFYHKNGRMYFGTKTQGYDCDYDGDCSTKQIPYYDLGINVWEYRNKIKAYKDIIRFAISPEFPIEINFSLDSKSNLSHLWSSYVKWTVKGLRGTPVANFQGAISGIMNWYIGKKTDTAKYAKKYETIITNWLLLANKKGVYKFDTGYAFIGFQAKTRSEYKIFNEVYGNYSNVDQVSKNTVAYTVKGTPPPVPEGVPWNTVDFWSTVFNTQMGRAMLNAVGNNMPVKIRTKANAWKDTKVKATVRTKTKDVYYYVFQDFTIEIGKNNNILIKYDSGMGSITKAKRKKKMAAWKKFLIGVAILVVIAIAITVIPAALAASGSAGTSIVSGISTPAMSIGTLSTPAMSIGAPAMSIGAPAMSIGTAAIPTIGTAAVTGATLSTAATTTSSLTTAWEAIKKAAPSIGKQAAKYGVGKWSAEKKAKMEAALRKAGASGVVSPVGLRPDGSPIYEKKQIQEAGMFGLSTINIALFMGAGIVASLLFGGRGGDRREHEHELKKHTFKEED